MGGGGEWVIGNGVCTFYVHSPFIIIACTSLICCLTFDNFLDRWEVWHLRYANHPFHVSVIHICKFHLCGELHF